MNEPFYLGDVEPSIRHKLTDYIDAHGLTLSTEAIEGVLSTIGSVLPIEAICALTGMKAGLNIRQSLKAQADLQRLRKLMFQLFFESLEKLDRLRDYTVEQLGIVHEDIQSALRYTEERKVELLIQMTLGVLDPARKLRIDKHNRFKRWMESLDLAMIDLLCKIDFTNEPQGVDWIETVIDDWDTGYGDHSLSESYAGLVRPTLEGLGIFHTTRIYNVRNVAQDVVADFADRMGMERRLPKLKGNSDERMWFTYHPDLEEFCAYLRQGMYS